MTSLQIIVQNILRKSLGSNLYPYIILSGCVCQKNLWRLFLSKNVSVISRWTKIMLLFDPWPHIDLFLKPAQRVWNILGYFMNEEKFSEKEKKMNRDAFD